MMNFMLARLNVLSKPDSLNIDGQALPHPKSLNIHIESPGYCINLTKVKILDREACWFERGVNKAIYP